MDSVSRRDTLLGLAGAVFGLLPLRAEAQLNVIKGTTKEKTSKKKGGVRCVILRVLTCSLIHSFVDYGII
jgi:hypothetical protein